MTGRSGGAMQRIARKRRNRRNIGIRAREVGVIKSRNYTQKKKSKKYWDPRLGVKKFKNSTRKKESKK